MLTDTVFYELIEAASLAPSADNMQPWEFRKQSETIEIYCACSRALPTDVMNMFVWISIGAAIQNIILAATKHELDADVAYNSANENEPVAVITFKPGTKKIDIADFICSRCTNRSPFSSIPLEVVLIEKLNQSIQSLNANIHWATSSTDFERIAFMDAHSSYIRLEHKPLHDELFSILRFTKKDMEKFRFGLTFESLDVPKFAVSFAKLLQHWSVNQIVSNMGIGRLVAKQLSNKLKAAGGICLITASGQNNISYMEAGRALEQFWLTATAIGLSVQPYGVLPQYLTKIDIEPETFLPRYVTAIEKHKKPFYEIFPKAKNEYPAIVLRVGWAGKQSARSDVRITINQLVRK
jgi:nitroreductase